MMTRYFYISTFSLLVLLLPIQVFSLDKTHNMGTFRGAMLGTDVTNEDILEFGQQWNANLVRWQLNWWQSDSNETDIDAYWNWLLAELDRLDEVLDYCRTAGLKVVVDLHTAPGGRDSNNINQVFKQQQYLDAYYEVWETIATRYKGNTTIWAFDLLNEPLEYKNSFNVTSLDNLMTTVAGKIRAIDSDRTLIVEPGDYGGVDGYADFSPIDYANIVYSVHMYEPIHFTHQGISGFSDESSSYPGFVNGEWWDKNELKNVLAPVLAFQTKYDVPIYVGEFSAIRRAPDDSAYQYIKDCIEIFEEYGWDWTYHAFREWQGWSVEHIAGIHEEIEATNETERAGLLKQWFSVNNKPLYQRGAEFVQVNTQFKELDSNHIIYFLLEINYVLKEDVSVDYFTENISAEAGKDYFQSSGTATIPSGELSTMIPVTIIGDENSESNETFNLVLENPQGAAFPEGITQIRATRILVNDD